MAIEDDSLGGSSSRTQGETAAGNLVMIDHNHPLYLSSSDVPGALSVGIQLKGMENYTLWSRVMEIALLGRNKIVFIDGSVLRTILCGAEFGIDAMSLLSLGLPAMSVRSCSVASCTRLVHIRYGLTSRSDLTR